MSTKKNTCNYQSDLGMLTLDQCKSILAVDGFEDNNLFQYYVCTNAWLLLINEYSEHACWSVKAQLLQKGLKACIADASELANQLIRNDGLDCYGTDSGYWMPLMLEELGSDIILQLLRFPKRFTVVDANLQKSCLDEYKLFNTGRKKLMRAELPVWLVAEVREAVADIVDWEELRLELPNILDYCYFSAGSTADCGRDKRRKAQTLLKEADLLGSYMGPNPHWGSFLTLCGVEHSCLQRHLGCVTTKANVVQPVQVQAVPKNYKKYRIIAMENASTAFFAQGLNQLVRRFIKDSHKVFIPLDDQDVQRERARLASISGSLATIDLSSASDSILETLFRDVFPSWFVTLCDMVRSKYLNISSAKHLRHIAWTSGHPLTFVIESVLFCAIADAATAAVSRFTGEQYEKPSTYGDDLICDVGVCDTLVEYLSLLGFVVNADKSFWGQEYTYRESCGVEYIRSIPMHSIYWPRKAVNPTATGIAALCELQHRVFSLGWRSSSFLTDVVNSITGGKMTSSAAGSQFQDLWALVPRCDRVYSPYGEIVSETSTRLAYFSDHSKHLKTYHKNKLRRLPRREESYWETHIAVVPKSAKVTDRTQYDESYLYFVYLQCGPQYDSPLDRLLGVSTQRIIQSTPKEEDFTLKSV